MNFDYNDVQQMVLESADRLMTARGTVEQWRARRSLPDGLDPAGWAQFAELGWLALPVPEAAGGLGGSMDDVALLMTALGKGLAVEPYVSTAVLGAHILAAASRTDMLEAVASGSTRLALAHNELADRFDVATPRATVARVIPDGYTLDGAKTLALDAPSADQLIVSATLDGEEGTASFLVDQARRRAENLQDVPLSITAVSGAALAQRGVRDALDLQYQTPSLTVTANGASRSSVSYAIRGQRTNEVQLLTDPPVGTYFADVVEPRTYGFGTSFYDLQNVQILKGVQGTLFGRNMTGGAVLVEPNHPDFSGAHAEATAQYGNYNLRDVTGMVNLPIIADTLAVRAAGTYRARDGFTTDVSNGRRYDDQNYYAFRLSSTLKIDRFESYTVFDYVKESENGTALKLTGYALADPLNGKPTIIAQQIGASPFFPVAAGAPPQDLLTLFKRDIALPKYQVNFGGAGTGVLSGTWSAVQHGQELGHYQQDDVPGRIGHVQEHLRLSQDRLRQSHRL